MVAASGVPKRLQFAGSVKDDCSDKGRATIKLIEAPQHGTVQIAPAMDFPVFPWTDARYACNQRRIAGTSVHYTSRAGFVGTDIVAIDVIFVEGLMVHHRFNIDVR